MRLPWGIALTIDARAAFATLGVAACVVFLLASFAAVGGLRSAQEVLGERFVSDEAFAWRGDPMTSTFPEAELPAVPAPILLRVKEATADGVDVLVVEARGPGAATIPEGSAEAGLGALLSLGAGPANVSAAGPPAELRVLGESGARWIPFDGLHVSSADFGRVASVPAGSWSAAYFPTLSDDARRLLAAHGFEAGPALGIVPFFQAGSVEVADSLWVVVAGTGFLVALLLHNLFSLELKARSRDFGVLRAVGATPREVAGLLSARAMFLAGIGLAIGTAGVLGGLRLAPTFVAEAARFASPSGRTLLVVAGVVLVSAAAGAGLVVARVLRTPARRLLGGSP